MANDLYVHGELVIYEIFDGMKLDIRCYTITALKDADADQYKFTLEGTYQEVK